MGVNVISKYSSADKSELDSSILTTDTNLKNTFYSCLELIEESAPEFMLDIKCHTNTIVPIKNPSVKAFSIDALIGAIYVTPEEDIIDTIDLVVHENGHNKLDKLNEIYPLLKPDEKLYPSPWRKDLRPMEGIIHGAYVHLRLNYLLSSIQERYPEYENRISGRIKYYKNQVISAIETIEKHADLTSYGKEFIHSLRIWSDKGP
uniref:aKG-HExxH-type peptide beta-hydroxylase n=1 Tax=Litoribacterium kuwaitense TaxID=1398745 RepID=UPI0013EC488A|nr:HEXXH motif-containing putative peptide modification protein [Litoribacterium kuwaitense]NGP46773.1 hypothetical protein [Litoribacterium kuwaitense]